MDDRVDGIIREWRTSAQPRLSAPGSGGSSDTRLALPSRQIGLDRGGLRSEPYRRSRCSHRSRPGWPAPRRTPSELAETLLLTTGSMTVRLNRLQRAGLIERLPNPRDGRGVLVRLTPVGKELADDS